MLPIFVGGQRCSSPTIIAERSGDPSAPLAQSVEHSHGKAGVVGSIPTGGSKEDARFEGGRRVYNACLGEALRWCRALRVASRERYEEES